MTTISSPSVSFAQPLAPFVDGTLLTSESDDTVDVINPSTGRPVLRIPVGSDVDVDRAVISARRAFQEGRWREMPPSARKAILHRLADLIKQENVRLDAFDAEEMGKPIAERRASAASSADLMRFYAEAVDKIVGDVFNTDRPTFVVHRPVPVGVVAAVVPWNFPTCNAVSKVGPALAAGNSVVLKPSELSSRSAIRLAQLALEAGVPQGVFNVVPGLGESVGRALALHQDVNMITFTGSTEVGKLMLQYSGQSNLKRVLVECGGKSPQIVFDDGVDLTAATDSIADSLLTNQGQICSVGSRVLVRRSLEEALLEKLGARLKRAQIGDAMDPQTTFGPLASAPQCTRVMRYIEGAVADGARLFYGGRQILRASGGFFVEPTVFGGVSPLARIAQEEIFGPVLSVIPFDDEAEAIRIANGTKYGLAAYVWTANLARAMRMAKEIESAVFINAATPTGEGPGDAFSNEPCRQSGIGAEGGMAGLHSYMRRQLVWINHA